MKDAATRQKFVELRGEGWSYDRIALELSVSKSTLITWSRELSADIENARAMTLDRLREQHALSQIARLQRIGEQLSRIAQELSTRDLSDVSTTNLVKLFLEFDKQLKNETVPLQFHGKSTMKDLLPVEFPQISWEV